MHRLLMGRRFLALASLAVFALLLSIFGPSAARSQTVPHFDPIEISGSPGVGTRAIAMTKDGSVVVGDQAGGGMRWTSGGTVDDPCVPNPDNGCSITGVNSQLGMVGERISSGTITHKLVWESGRFGPYELTCPGNSDGCYLGAMAGSSYSTFLIMSFTLNSGHNRGAYIGSTVSGAASYRGPFLTANADSSVFAAINSDGSVAAGNMGFQADNLFHGLYVNGSNVCDIDPSGALGNSYINALDSSGSVAVGTASAVPGNAVKFVGLSDHNCTPVVVPLPHVLSTPGGSFVAGAVAKAVSDNGVIVGSVTDTVTAASKAFRWTCFNGMESIEQLLVDSGAGFRDLANLTEAVAISSDGTKIAGNGNIPNANATRAWQATLPLPSSPTLQMTPSTDMIFAGSKGGPFAALSYALGRSGGSNVYTVSGLPNWLSVSSGTGFMTNTATTLQFSVNSNANTLAPGTYGPFTVTVSFTNADCSLGSQTRTVTLNIGSRAHDFDGDSKSDIVWRNTSGEAGIWFMNGGSVTSAPSLGAVPNNWSIVGQRDFDGNGKSDLLWRNASGDIGIWFMNGATVMSAPTLGNVSNAWSVVGTGDFDGDGKADILWRNTNGDLGIWFMNGATILSAPTIANVPTNWSVIATADFDGDGKADILWRNTTNDIGIWIMNGSSITSAPTIGNVGPAWSVVGTGNLDGDGKSDILWRNTANDLGVWFMNGTALMSAPTIGNTSAAWSVASVGDYNGDGKSDILLRSSSNDVGIWFMNGAAVTSAPILGNVGPSWQVQNAASN